MDKLKSEPIFTIYDIDAFKNDINKYQLTLDQLMPAVLDHIKDKGENFNIRSYNINTTIENMQNQKTTHSVIKYMENMLKAYNGATSGKS